MAPNEQARKNHDELFPGHVSTLAVTDPELIEIFDNFAFDEVLRHGKLDARTRRMVQLASRIAGQAVREYRIRPGPFDQRGTESREDVLVYTTPVLAQDVEVTGPITVHLWATSSAPDTDFVARLVDVYPDSYAQNLTDGIIRARYRNFSKGEAPTLIEPGKAYEYEIDLIRGAVEDVPLSSVRNVYEVNLFALIQVTQAC